MTHWNVAKLHTHSFHIAVLDKNTNLWHSIIFMFSLFDLNHTFGFLSHSYSPDTDHTNQKSICDNSKLKSNLGRCTTAYTKKGTVPYNYSPTSTVNVEYIHLIICCLHQTTRNRYSLSHWLIFNFLAKKFCHGRISFNWGPSVFAFRGLSCMHLTNVGLTNWTKTYHIVFQPDP